MLHFLHNYNPILFLQHLTFRASLEKYYILTQYNHIVSLTRDLWTRVCMSTTTTFNTLQNIVRFYTNEKSLFRFWIEIFVSRLVTLENKHGNVQRPLICTFTNENSRKALLFSFQVYIYFSYCLFRLRISSRTVRFEVKRKFFTSLIIFYFVNSNILVMK